MIDNSNLENEILVFSQIHTISQVNRTHLQ